MGNDWQDSSFEDRRQSGDARQRQAPQSSQSWEYSSRQDWRPEATDGPPPSRGPLNQSSGPLPPRQTGNLSPRQTGSLAPHNGSGMLSRARNGGSGPLPPRERTTRQFDPEPAGPPDYGSRGMTPPRTGSLGSRSSAPDNEATAAGNNNYGRRISAPRERSRAEGGGGLLSFARAASNTMRAIITGRRQAVRPDQPMPAMTDGPAVPVIDPDQPRRRFQPYRRSRSRLVIHKRLERRQRRGKKLLISSIVVAFLTLIIVGLSVYGGSNAYGFYTDTQKYLGALSNQNGFPLTTRFFDRNGVLLYAMYDVPNSTDQNAAYRYYDDYGQISNDLKNATVDIEDKTFWTNSGIDPFGILRAGLNDTSSQGNTQGGSTITQQLIKNAFFVDPKTGAAPENLQRKIQEALMAYAVSQKYSKQDVLEFYLNIIPYGYLSRGIEAAAQNIFSIQPKIDSKTNQYITAAQQLTLAQSALLAGLPRNPSQYSPCGGGSGEKDRRTAALGRMHDVLTAMLKQGDITQAQWNTADAESDVKDNGAKFFKCQSLGQELAPHFVDYVRDQLAMMLTTDGTLATGWEILAHAGLNVYTTLDYNLEQFVEQDEQKYLYNPYTTHFSFENGTFPALQDSSGCRYCYSIHDAATVVMDPNTGDILAMDGSGDYNNNNHDNYVDPKTGQALSYDPREGGEDNAAIAYRQPGSSFKPIVYAAAFEMGWFPGLVLKNQWTCFPVVVSKYTQSKGAQQACGSWYAPENYGGGFLTDTKGGVHGVPDPGVRIREALDWSLNIPAVQALEFAGLDNVINLAHRMGIYGDPSDGGKYDTFNDYNKGPSIALGSAGIRLLDMVDAYSVFANGGYHIPPRSILLVTDAQGNVIPGGDFHSISKTQVISPQAAFLITNILSDNAARTYEFGSNSALYFGGAPYAAAKTGTTDDFKDNLTIGYTPSLSVGVWSGNANDEAMQTTIGITGAAPIWHDVVAWATQHYNFPTSYWPVPPGVSRYMVNGATGLAPYQGMTGDYADWFNDAEVPSVS
jgi:membrane peptidoglycan carboxypeptidase